MRWFNRRHKKKYEKWKNFQPNLKVADIIFLRERGNFTSWLIRKFTKSHWSHVALVFAVPNKKLLFNNYLIIEANQTGLEVHRIQKYTKHLNKYDIAVKRVLNLDKQTRERVVTFMLNNVDKKYDLTRTIAFVLRSFDLDLTKGLSPLFVNKNDFTCSTFIQKAFYQAVSRDKKKNVLFTDKLKFDSKGNIKEEGVLEDHLDYITPKDLAKSKCCEWLYNKHY